MRQKVEARLLQEVGSEIASTSATPMSGTKSGSEIASMSTSRKCKCMSATALQIIFEVVNIKEPSTTDVLVDLCVSQQFSQCS